jgi:hypothetical protein
MLESGFQTLSIVCEIPACAGMTFFYFLDNPEKQLVREPGYFYRSLQAVITTTRGLSD